MGWEQLEAIRAIQAAEIEAEQDLLERPTYCPICGTRLDVNADDVRNCPLGHFRTGLMAGFVSAGPGAPGDGSVRIGELGALPSGGSVGQLLVNTGPGSGGWADPPAVVAFVAHSNEVAYAAADQTLTLTGAGLPPVQLTSVGSVIRFLWPPAIERNRVDPVQIALPGGTALLKDGGGGPVIPSMVTPDALAEMVLFYVGGAYQWRLLGQLAQRPQDYRIYAGYSFPDPQVGEQAYDVDSFTFFTESDSLMWPAPTVNGARPTAGVSC